MIFLLSASVILFRRLLGQSDIHLGVKCLVPRVRLHQADPSKIPVEHNPVIG